MVIGSKMTLFSFRSLKNGISNILQMLYIARKIVKTSDFVDEIEIKKVRSTAEIFSFMAKFVFYGL